MTKVVATDSGAGAICLEHMAPDFKLYNLKLLVVTFIKGTEINGPLHINLGDVDA